MASRLVYTQQNQAVQNAGMNLLSTIGHNTDNDLEKAHISIMKPEDEVRLRPSSKRLDPMSVNFYASTGEQYSA